jgi:hypothetical protein
MKSIYGPIEDVGLMDAQRLSAVALLDRVGAFGSGG